MIPIIFWYIPAKVNTRFKTVFVNFFLVRSVKVHKLLNLLDTIDLLFLKSGLGIINSLNFIKICTTKKTFAKNWHQEQLSEPLLKGHLFDNS